jgi:hypothetical protein
MGLRPADSSENHGSCWWRPHGVAPTSNPMTFGWPRYCWAVARSRRATRPVSSLTHDSGANLSKPEREGERAGSVQHGAGRPPVQAPSSPRGRSLRKSTGGMARIRTWRAFRQISSRISSGGVWVVSLAVSYRRQTNALRRWHRGRSATLCLGAPITDEPLLEEDVLSPQRVGSYGRKGMV